MNAVVTYAEDGRDRYTLGVPRLSYSLREHAPDLPLFVVAPALGPRVAGRENLAGSADFRACPSHRTTPYAFKPFVVRALAARGYTSILWCDASITICRDPGAVFRLAEQKGVIAYENEGRLQAHWTSDDALAAMGCPLETARTLPQIMGGVVAFCVTHRLGRQTLDEWWQLAKDGVSFAGVGGSTRPEFQAHRHDQSCLSWLLKKNGIAPEPYADMRNWDDSRAFAVPPIFVVRGVDSRLNQIWLNSKARWRSFRAQRSHRAP